MAPRRIIKEDQVEIITELYWKKNYNLQQIANRYEVHRSTLRNFMLAHEIPMRTIPQALKIGKKRICENCSRPFIARGLHKNTQRYCSEYCLKEAYKNDASRFETCQYCNHHYLRDNIATHEAYCLRKQERKKLKEKIKELRKQYQEKGELDKKDICLAFNYEPSLEVLSLRLPFLIEARTRFNERLQEGLKIFIKEIIKKEGPSSTIKPSFTVAALSYLYGIITMGKHKWTQRELSRIFFVTAVSIRTYFNYYYEKYFHHPDYKDKLPIVTDTEILLSLMNL